MSSSSCLAFVFPWCVAALVCGAATPALAQDDGVDPFGEGEAAVPVLTDLSPKDTRVLLGAELLRRGYRTVGEALAYEAGFSRERTSRGFRYALRGVPAGVLLVVDDVPQIVDGERDVLDVDDIVSLVDVDRVEIVRGPVTAIHGAGALVGVVRITTVKPGLTGASVRAAGTWLAGRLPEPGEEDLAASGTLRAGDAGVRVSAHVRGGKPQLWRLHAVPERYESVPNPRTSAQVVLPVTKEDLDVATDDDAVTLRAVAQWSDFTLDAGVAQTTERAPVSAFSHGLAFAAFGDPQTTTRSALRGRLSWQRWLGPVHVEASAWAAGYTRRDDGPLYPRGGGFLDGGELAVEQRADTGGGVARVDVPLGADHRLVLSAFGDATALSAHSTSRDPRTGKPLDDTVALDDTTATAAAALEWQGDFGLGLHATAGLAAEARTAFPIAFAPRAALAWTPGADVTLRASYAEGTRAPDRYDVTALAQTVVDGRVVGAGSTDTLRPEHVRTLELSTSWAPSPKLTLDARAFGLRHEDALTNAFARGLLVPTNLAPSIVVGGEFTGSVMPAGEFLGVDGALAAARTIDGPGVDEDLLQAVAGLRVMPVEGVACGVRGRAVLRSAGESALADAWCALFPFGEHLGVTAAVKNVLDGNEPSIDRTAPPQADPLLLPSPGRTFLLAVEAHL